MTYSWPAVIVFATATVLMLTGAVGVLAVKNPVHAALSLIVTLFGVAVAFLAQSADFLAAVQIIVYAGAIVVLFLFVIMFLGVDQRSSNVEPLVGQRAFAVVGSALTVAALVAVMWKSHWTTGVMSLSSHGAPLAGVDGNVKQLGTSVFTTYLFAFEITSALLLIGVIGAVILARRPEEAGS